MKPLPLLVFVVLLATNGSVTAQPYPSKPIRLIVPSAAGSPPDVYTRWLADRLSPALGQPIIVDNRAGAGGIIGAAAAAKSPADGYTLVSFHQGNLSFNPHLYSQPGYDALKDFAPIARLFTSMQVLAVHVDVPAQSLAELIALAKANPRKLSLGSGPVGTPPHMAGELFHRMAGIEVTVVPFKAGNFAATELIAGRITYTLNAPAATLPHVRAGKARMLAVTGRKRSAVLPEVPTFAEAGLADYAYDTWAGICAPAGTPNEIVARLTKEIGEIVSGSQAREAILKLGWEPFPNDTPEAFAAYIKADHAKWGEIIRQAGIKVD